MCWSDRRPLPFSSEKDLPKFVQGRGSVHLQDSQISTDENARRPLAFRGVFIDI